MRAHPNSIIDAIGSTPLVELKNVAPSNNSRIVAKLESANPTGSMKDRMAKAVVEGAQSKRLRNLSPLIHNLQEVKSQRSSSGFSTLGRSGNHA